MNETASGGAGRRRGYGGRLPPAGASAWLLAVTNAHYELDAGADPNAAFPGYTVLHAITSVRKPGAGDNHPAPEGSGNMNSIELRRKLQTKQIY